MDYMRAVLVALWAGGGQQRHSMSVPNPALRIILCCWALSHHMPRMQHHTPHRGPAWGTKKRMDQAIRTHRRHGGLWGRFHSLALSSNQTSLPPSLPSVNTSQAVLPFGPRIKLAPCSTPPRPDQPKLPGTFVCRPPCRVGIVFPGRQDAVVNPCWKGDGRPITRSYCRHCPLTHPSPPPPQPQHTQWPASRSERPRRQATPSRRRGEAEASRGPS